jgi:hypothetical protein
MNGNGGEPEDAPGDEEGARKIVEDVEAIESDIENADEGSPENGPKRGDQGVGFHG